MFNKKLKFLIGILIILSIVFIYLFFFSSEEETATDQNITSSSNFNESMPSSITGSGSSESEDSQSKEILEMLSKIKNVKLDSEIFSNPVFNSLVDHTVQLMPEPVSRPNPFAPL